MIKNILLVGLTFFKIFANAQNFSVTYGFPEVTPSSGQTDPSNTPTVNGLQLGSFKANGDALSPNASGRFSFTNWPLGALNTDNNYGNYTAVLSPTVFYEMVLFVNAGYTLNLTQLNFDVRRSGTGIRTYCVRSSLDNYTNNLSASTGTNTNLSVIPSDIFFWNFDSVSTSKDQRGSQITFNSAFAALTGSLSFRFYAWNSESSGGSFSLDNVNLKGSVVDSVTLTSFQSNTIITNTALKVYPNPCSTHLLQIKSEYPIIGIELIDENGKLIYIKQNSLQNHTAEINTANLPQGYVILQVLSENRVERKLIYLSPE